MIMHLDQYQQEAVNCQKRWVGVIAPAGSGKTRVFIERLLKLIDSKACKLDEILCITYTKVAAEEIKQRLQAKDFKLGVPKYMNTIHSCFLQELLRREHWQELGYDARPDIAEDWEIKKVYKQLKEESSNIPHKFKDFQNEIRTHKLTKTNPKFKSIVQRYNHLLREQRLIDYDDILIGIKALISQDSKIGQKLRNKWKYVLMDECQDSPEILFDIFKEIANKGENNTHFFIVGDPNQSIFGFAGASGNPFKKMEEISEGQLKIITLVKNYRSGKKIIDHCNKYRYDTNLPQSEAVENSIEGQILESGLDTTPKKLIHENPKKSHAILYRRNDLSKSWIKNLVSWNKPFNVGQKTFDYMFDQEAAEDILNSLKCILFLNFISFERFFSYNDPNKHIFKSYFQKNIKQISLGQIPSVPREFTSFKQWNLLESFILLKREKRNLSKYMQEIKEGLKVHLKKDFSIRKYTDMFETIERWIKQTYELNKDNYSLPEIIAQLEQYLMHSTCNISLSSIHGSKGLEWDSVVILESEEIRKQLLGDEGKLYYVAASRAKETLLLS